MAKLVEHLEKHLGRIEKGWDRTPDRDDIPFQVIACRGGAHAGVRAFSTLGLSSQGLRSAVSEKVIHQELFLAVPETFGEANLPALLQQVGLEAIEANLAYLRGDVIGPRGPLLDGKTFEALYVAMPVYFPDSFGACRLSDSVTVVIAWLIPITKREAAFVARQGWGAFEDRLVRTDPNLFDLDRGSIV